MIQNNNLIDKLPYQSENTKQISKYIIRVYTILMMFCCAYIFGVYAGIVGYKNEFPEFILVVYPFIAMMISILLLATRINKMNLSMIIAFSAGMMSFHLIYNTLKTDPSIVIIACLSTIVIFCIMSFVTYFSQFNDLYYTSAIISNLLLIPIIISIASLFFNNVYFHMFDLIVTLYIFSMSIIHNTQSMIKKAKQFNSNNEGEQILAALSLFLDLTNIFPATLKFAKKLKQD